MPFGMPQMLAACEFDIAPPREIVVAGDTARQMIRLLWKNFDPNRILLHAGPEIARYQPAIAAMNREAAQTAVYICENFACQRAGVRAKKISPDC